MAGGGLGVLLLIGLVVLMGGDLGDVLRVVQQQPGAPMAQLAPEQQARQDEQVTFVSQILKLTEDVWNEQFAQAGGAYREPTLTIFRGATETACGLGQQAMGPFYCPADQQVYIDLAFFDQLERELNAPGDFAQAYVVAHEVGHHVQKQLGYSDLVNDARGRVGEEEMNQLSVRLELQADYLAGVWAHHAERRSKVLEPGDLEEGLRAAKQIGDDMLQRQATGRVVPENFTHGTSAQRMRWLREGLKTGDASREALDRFFDMPYNQL
jgi:predicted metalloprotease